jgi:hypothetical protein
MSRTNRDSNRRSGQRAKREYQVACRNNASKEEIYNALVNWMDCPNIPRYGNNRKAAAKQKIKYRRALRHAQINPMSLMELNDE